MNNDITYMAKAIALARLGRFTTSPNPNVGCVLVRDDCIVGEGYHHRAGGPHAEINALASAGTKAAGATAYVTLEPCSHYGRTPPCANALIKAGVKRVVIAMQDPNPRVAGNGIAALRQAGIETHLGVLEEQAERLNSGFLKRMRTGLPYIQLKLAASLDGRSAMASGESKWITSAQSRQDVQLFRAQSSAILSTGVTVLADNPSLNVRWSELPEKEREMYPQSSLRQPIRIVIDSQNRVTPQHQLISQPGETWLIRKSTDALSWPGSVQQLPVRLAQQQIDLVSLMHTLAERQINSVWVEAGAHLAGGLLQAGLVDELIVYLAPRLLGSDARGLCYLPGLTALSQAPQFSLTDVSQIGPDVRLRLKPVV